MVTEGLLPFSFVDMSSLRRFTESLNPAYSVPSRKHMTTKLLPAKTAGTLNKIKDLLNSAKDVAVTVDIWTSRDMRSYMGLTSHFILDYTLHSAMLSCTRFRGSHTGESIRDQYDEILSVFSISNKVCATVTDNAANMTRAFVTLPGLEMSQTDDDYADLTPNESIETDPELQQCLPEHYRCFSHTLQLVVRDGLKDAGQMGKVLNKVSKLVSYVHHSTVAAEILEADLRLEVGNATRWNSQLRMIRSLLRIDSDTLDKLDCQHKLNIYEMNIMRELCEILSPFETATDMTQGENHVTASLVVPCVRGLRAEVAELSQTYACKMVKTLADSIEKRLSSYETKDVFTSATSLDPRFKLMWCNDDNERADIRQILIEKVEMLSPDILRQEVALASPPQKRPKLFSFMNNSPKRSVPTPMTRTAEDQVDAYLDEAALDNSTNPLQYWQNASSKYPQLAQVACSVFQIPASSAPVERIFSQAGRIFRPDRCSLKDDNFEQLMFLRCNANMA